MEKNNEVLSQIGPATRERIDCEIESIEAEAAREHGFVRRTPSGLGHEFIEGLVATLEQRGWIVQREGKTLNCYKLSLAWQPEDSTRVRKVLNRVSTRPASSFNTVSLDGEDEKVLGPFFGDKERKLQHCQFVYGDNDEVSPCLEVQGKFYCF